MSLTKAEVRATEYLIVGIGFLGAAVAVGVYYISTYPFL